jgi:hypothetical protein
MKHISAFVGASALAVSWAASAAPTLTMDGSGNPTGVTGLVVDGTTYNVTFSTDSYNTLFPSSPTFGGNSAGADDASGALAAVLLAANITSLDSPNGDCTTEPAYCYIITPDGLDTANPAFPYPVGYAAVEQNAPDGDFTWTGLPYEYFGASVPLSSVNYPGLFNQVPSSDDYGGLYLEYAVYTEVAAGSGPTTVPEPTTLSLLGLGLAALGWMRKSKG